MEAAKVTWRTSAETIESLAAGIELLFERAEFVAADRAWLEKASLARPPEKHYFFRLAESIEKFYLSLPLSDAATWIEFNLESGPQRRTRFENKTTRLYTRVDRVEKSDPGGAADAEDYAAGLVEYLRELAALIRRTERSSGGGDALVDPLTPAEMSILLALEASPTTTTAEKIEGWLSKQPPSVSVRGVQLSVMEERSVRTTLNSLIERGFVIRPRGKKGGSAITDKGRRSLPPRT